MAAIYSDLAGKVVLVTGGASGIGAAIVRRFAQQKSVVLFFDIKAGAGAALARELTQQDLQAHFAAVDLTDTPALQAAIAQARATHGPIDILINNAAHDERHPTETVTPDYWDDRIAVNLKHQFFAAQAVLPGMKAKNGRHRQFRLDLLDGGARRHGGLHGIEVGGARAHAFARTRLRPFNIRVNAIAPGWIMTERQIEKWLTPESEAELMRRQCLKRKLMPDELARFTVFLASEEASPARRNTTSWTAAGCEATPRSVASPSGRCRSAPPP